MDGRFGRDPFSSGRVYPWRAAATAALAIALAASGDARLFFGGMGAALAFMLFRPTDGDGVGAREGQRSRDAKVRATGCERQAHLR